MFKIFLKIKKKLISKGFTLVELLAVIVILAIIMLIAIPGVLSVLEYARVKSFTEFVDKSANLAQKQLAEDGMNDVLSQILKEKDSKLGKYTNGMGGLF